MEAEGGGAGGSGSEEAVVQLEEAVELLVEHLVGPVLPLDPGGRKGAISPETQEVVARQLHAIVLLYNYYHRKQFPQLKSAGPDQFCKSTSLTVANKNIHMYLDLSQSSITGKAIVDACDIAEALDHTKDSPDMTMWPISKVGVMLLNQTKKVCLLERGSETKGIWSMLEKDISSDMSVEGLNNKSMALASGPYMLQQIAYTEVELKTGLKRTNLRYIEEHREYSLSKKGTATMLFLLEYDQNVDSKLKEMSLDALIKRMSGRLFECGPYPRTTSVVECYHLMPYKEVLLNVVDRYWTLGSLLSASKEQQANNNSKSKMKKITTGVSTRSTSKNRKDSSTNYKRKFEAFNTNVAIYEEHRDHQSPTKDLQACVQMDKNITEKNSNSGNVAQDIIPTPDVDPVIKNHALISQKEKVTETSGGITGTMNVQRYATLQLLQKMRDDTLHEHFVLGDRSAEYEKDIQTILTETEMPKITSILKKYENSWNMMEGLNPISGEGCQTITIKKKKLKEAILVRNKCQVLDDICRESNWILPRYAVLPSVTSDMYQASVHLMGPDFNLTADGDMKVTPHEARDSAASMMLSQLQRKARED